MMFHDPQGLSLKAALTLGPCVCVCVCVRARARVCVCTHASARCLGGGGLGCQSSAMWEGLRGLEHWGGEISEPLAGWRRQCKDSSPRVKQI